AVPVRSHLRSRQTEDFRNDPELEGGHLLVQKGRHEPIPSWARLWHDFDDIWHSCRLPPAACHDKLLPRLAGRALLSNNVISMPAAPSSEASAHFERLFRFETDCWDVHDALSSGRPGFVLLDVRSLEHFKKGHVPGALNLPHGKIIATRMAAWPPQKLFVVYCAGPHCNGAARAAVRLSAL